MGSIASIPTAAESRIRLRRNDLHQKPCITATVEQYDASGTLVFLCEEGLAGGSRITVETNDGYAESGIVLTCKPDGGRFKIEIWITRDARRGERRLPTNVSATTTLMDTAFSPTVQGRIVDVSNRGLALCADGRLPVHRQALITCQEALVFAETRSCEQTKAREFRLGCRIEIFIPRREGLRSDFGRLVRQLWGPFRFTMPADRSDDIKTIVGV